METRKLYYEDSHLRHFCATVTGCEQSEKGWLVTLNATAFYPEGGGQACDLGSLNGVKVLAVYEEGERILHLCDGALEVGVAVEGEIDWTRRFDLMQQHSGEHIVSGLIHQKFGGMNTGFHVGTTEMEVDFDVPLTALQVAEVERCANEAVWQNLEIQCWTPDPQELPTVFYRRKRELPWPVRIVRVPGYDSCACCGVHVKKTGEIGLIKILSCVSLRGGVRLRLVCGKRAYDWVAHVFEENRLVSQVFSVPMEQTGGGAQKMNEALAAEKYRAAGLQSRVAALIAESYVNHGDVLHFEDGLDSAGIRQLAERIAAVCGGRAAVFSGSDGNYGYCLASTDGDLRDLCKEMNAQLCGRGGGKPCFQQGSVQTTQAQIRAFFEG
ncbi:MAG: alanyl-tRNA editing protein [Ruminococcaceae bacterium]|nr:alanyl-tRNA editing protein [Oscillospiraceae bacterium]